MGGRGGRRVQRRSGACGREAGRQGCGRIDVQSAARARVVAAQHLHRLHAQRLAEIHRLHGGSGVADPGQRADLQQGPRRTVPATTRAPSIKACCVTSRALDARSREFARGDRQQHLRAHLGHLASPSSCKRLTRSRGPAQVAEVAQRVRAAGRQSHQQRDLVEQAAKPVGARQRRDGVEGGTFRGQHRARRPHGERRLRPGGGAGTDVMDIAIFGDMAFHSMTNPRIDRFCSSRERRAAAKRSGVTRAELAPPRRASSHRLTWPCRNAGRSAVATSTRASHFVRRFAVRSGSRDTVAIVMTTSRWQPRPLTPAPFSAPIASSGHVMAHQDQRSTPRHRFRRQRRRKKIAEVAAHPATARIASAAWTS